MIQDMARKNYSEEFRRNAAELYESTPGATVRGIAEDLGIERGTLRGWLQRHGTGKKTAEDGSPAVSPLKTASRLPGGVEPPGDETPGERIVRLEGRVAALEAERTKLATEREILQRAAKYFAGETNW